jgi:hypothetical protein
MDLLERYLQAVRKYLPWNFSRSRQDDILAELRANLESQLDERQADLGRPLTEGETIDWLKQLGAPIQMAARYQPVHYLIGPPLFPIYLYVLRLAAFWAVVIYCIVSAVLLWVGKPDAASIAESILRVPGVLFTVAAWVTLIFVVLERVFAHNPHLCLPEISFSAEWSPSKLPPLDPAPTRGKKPRNFAQATAEVIFGYLFLIWLSLMPKYPILVFGPGAYLLHNSPFALTPVWWTFYWVALAANYGQVVWNTIDLVRGTWRKRQPMKLLFFTAFGLVANVVLLAAPNHIYALLRSPELYATKYGPILDGINTYTYRVVLLICAIAVVQLVWRIVQWFRESRHSAAQ